MSQDESPPDGKPFGPDDAVPNPPGTKPYSQEVQHSQIAARVSEKAARGVFSTGAVVLQGQQEFVLDFLQRLAKPHQVAARVVLPPAVIPRLIAALRENLRSYQQRFGPIPQPQAFANPGTQSSPQELYDELKLGDDVICGNYANAVVIGHTPNEFCFDFITSFFPRSAVSCRVYLSVPNVPRLLESLIHSFAQFQRRTTAQQENSGEDISGSDDSPNDH